MRRPSSACSTPKSKWSNPPPKPFSSATRSSRIGPPRNNLHWGRLGDTSLKRVSLFETASRRSSAISTTPRPSWISPPSSKTSKASGASPPPLPPLPPPLAPVPLPPLRLKRRPSSPSSSRMPARTRSASSKKSAPSPAWASRKPRTSSKPLRSPSRKTPPRPKPKTSRRSSRPLAPKSNSSNRLVDSACIHSQNHRTGRASRGLSFGFFFVLSLGSRAAH